MDSASGKCAKDNTVNTGERDPTREVEGTKLKGQSAVDPSVETAKKRDNCAISGDTYAIPFLLRGAAVIHGSGKDQVSKGDFLIGDEIADNIFGHRSSPSLVWWRFWTDLFAALLVAQGIESRGRARMAGSGYFEIGIE
jgi:hypothetical protein